MTLLNAQGLTVERRAVLPAGDLKLSDGRALRQRARVPGLPMYWRTPDGLRVLASVDPTHHGSLLHVSMSYSSRDPSWADIRAVRDVFYPSDIDVMMMLPKQADYVNIHPHTFHLWQTPVEWGVL